MMKLGQVPEMPWRAGTRIHCLHDRSLRLPLLVERKVGRGHSRESLLRREKVGKVEAEHLGLNVGFNARVAQLLEKKCRIGQCTRPHARNRWRASKPTSGLLKEDNVALGRSSPNRSDQPATRAQDPGDLPGRGRSVNY